MIFDSVPTNIQPKKTCIAWIEIRFFKIFVPCKLGDLDISDRYIYIDQSTKTKKEKQSS